MSDLWICFNPAMQRVVVRFIKEIHAQNKLIRKAFDNGIKVLGQLDHPGIVRLFDHGTHRGMPYMAVEYHENLNLRERLIKRSPILLEQPLLLVRQLANALNYMHQRGFLHLDIKPENMLIRDDGVLILVDFDLSITHKGKPIKLKMLQGTPAYLAPETMHALVVDERSEIYTFGVVVYELLTLHKPYEGSSMAEYQKSVMDMRVRPRPMTEFRKDIPPALEKIITMCLEKNAETRYPDMSLVLRDLNSLK